MKRTTLAIAVSSVFAFAGAAQAQDYQMEAGFTYVDVSVDTFSDSAIGVDFTYHLETVSTQAKPLAEAAFLGRNSNVGVSYLTFDELDSDTLGLSGEFWFEDIYVSADYASSDDADDVSLNLGYMFKDGLLGYVGIIDEDNVEEATLLLGTKYVAPIGDNFVSFEGELLTNDGNNVITLAGDYFINNALSVGVRMAESDVDGDETTWGLGAKYFIKPNVSGELEYTTQDETDIVMLRAAARF